ncbi:MAG: 3'-5' exonuclease [Candidatus Omnitrophota bacterium]|nr:3'-5' exonuclease [Candidatus Omnitrophota bacterium]
MNDKDDLALENVIFAFFDLETTGLEPGQGDKICEVAVLRTRSGQHLESFHSLVDPGRALSPAAYAVNGITQKMLDGKPKFKQISGQVLKMFDDAVIVCHNALFDIRFLKVELEEAGLRLPDYQIIDTLTLARKHFNFSNNSLGSIARFLGIKIEQSHRAMGDCITTHQVFERFLKDLNWRRTITLNKLLNVPR